MTPGESPSKYQWHKVQSGRRLTNTRPKFTVTDCFQNKIFCGKCGYAYHRSVSGRKWCYWYCAAKKHKGEGRCDSTINYTDYALRCVSAFMLGLEEFDEQVFTDRIKKITVEEDGSLTYRFKDGKEETWQRI